MRRRIIITTSVILLIAIGWTVALLLQPAPRTRLELARYAPGGALIYIEAQNLNRLLAQWQASSAHRRYGESANWRAFQNSRLYLRLLDRLQPIEAALGFELTEKHLSALAGSQSALVIYDIGNLEMLLITVTTRADALASLLFKQRSAFRQRTLRNQVYYVREGTHPETGEKAAAGFAFAQGMLIVASSENLLRRTLTNLTAPGDDRLSVSINRLVDGLTDFKPHDITVWLDQKRLNTDRYFKHYWIHKNRTELAPIEAALIDMEVTPTALRERRWFALHDAAPTDSSHLNALNELLRFAPNDATLMVASAAADLPLLSRLMADVLLGAPPRTLTMATMPTHRADDWDEADTDESSELSGTSGVLQLDDRFNKDIDDPTSFTSDAQRSRVAEPDSKSDERLLRHLAALLQPSEPAEFILIGDATLGENRLFVQFHRALVIRLNRPGGFDTAAFEQTVQTEFATRYIVRGVPARLSWNAEDQLHWLGQTLLDRGGAYARQGSYLLLANSREYARRILQAHRSSVGPSAQQSVTLRRFARVRVKQGAGAYHHIMSMLATPAASGELGSTVDLFSQNIAGLIQVVPNWTEVTVETAPAASLLREMVTYHFESSPATRPTQRTRRR